MKHAALWLLLLGAAIFYFSREGKKNSGPPPTPAPVTRHETHNNNVGRELQPAVEPKAAATIASPPPAPRKITDKKETKQLALPYKIHGNLFIVQGDIIAGAIPPGDTPDESGLVAMDPLKLWPNSTIPYHIQPEVPNPQRVHEALQLFEGTAIRFVKYESGNHALVFENGEANCFSYVGHVVAKQPILISPNCAPADIAHEILHALGFVHEQNRTDRDSYVEVNMNNVEEAFADNFEKLPTDYMKVSGLTDFDFHSLMIYPPQMFAKPGQLTMEPRSRDQLIQPSRGLSPKDVERLNRAYGDR